MPLTINSSNRSSMEVPPENRIYRPNVAVIIVNDEGKLLACHRSDKNGVWQIPQGGIDEGETPEQALYRELLEEIGTSDIDVLGRLSENIRYDWPPQLYSRGFHGQDQIYFLVRLSASATINLFAHKKIEFDKCEWLTSAEFITRLEGFKKDAYMKALDKLKQEFPNIIS